MLLACQAPPVAIPPTADLHRPTASLVTAIQAQPPARPDERKDVTLTVRWPERGNRTAQAIPDETGLILVTVTGNGVDLQRSLVRAEGVPLSRATFSLFPGEYTLTVECRKQASGADVLLARQVSYLKVAVDQPVVLTVRPVALPTPTVAPATPQPTAIATLAPTEPPSASPSASPTGSPAPVASPAPTPEPNPSLTPSSVPSQLPTPAPEDGLPVARLAPDDPLDPTTHHDYVITKNGIESTFVWIPYFRAYQLIKPQECGPENAGRPIGYWVASRPVIGTEDEDWAVEVFGGFYAGKYEASRADAVPGDPVTGAGATAGTATTFKVARYCTPWNASWDEARNACDAFDLRCRMISDEQWTALAVWAMIHDITVYGAMNNLGNGDTRDAEIKFTPSSIDYTALTGSGRRTNWQAGINRTSHTRLSSGAYDLCGNLEEFTSQIGYESGYLTINGSRTLKNYRDYNGVIISLATEATFRRYGLANRGTDSFIDLLRIDYPLGSIRPGSDYGITRSIRGCRLGGEIVREGLFSQNFSNKNAGIRAVIYY